MNYFDSGDPQRGREMLVLHTVMAAGWRAVRKIVARGGLAGIFLAIAVPGSVQADVVANVRFASGLVTAEVAGQPLSKLSKGDGIEGAARIDTAANSRVQMRFTDGGLVSLMPESTFSVEEYRYANASEDEGALVFGMLRGGLRTMTGAIGKTRHEDYQLNTPVATLGIRGTEYTAVLNPPNTLRVHVGRGKVVITNEQGSLEVPAGRNAVVSLGSAPVFSEQEPLYLATSPGGLLLQAAGEVTQDPFFGPPLVDLDIAPLVSALSPAPGAGPGLGGGQPPVSDPNSPAPPVTSGPPVAPPLSLVLPDGVGYSVAGIVESQGFQPWYASQAGGFSGTFDANSGALLSLGNSASPTSIVAPGGFQIENVITSGALSWGEFTDGSGPINGVVEFRSPGQYLPYIVGLASEVIPAGMLNFSLEGATSVRDKYGGTGSLDQFDLGLSIATSAYTLTMQLTAPQSFGVYTAVAGGSLQGGAQGFQLGIPMGSVNAGGVQCTSCSLDVSGFLAGQNAQQAGVSYLLTDLPQDNAYFGVAGLKR